MSKNKDDLSEKPFSIFVVCMTLAMKSGYQYHSFVSSQLEPVRMILNPVGEGIYSGILELSKIQSFSGRLKFRISVLFGVWKEGDHRNWEEIQYWTKNLKSEIDKKYTIKV